MSIARSSVHVSVPVEQLLGDLVLGAKSLDAGLVQMLTANRKQVSLNRFITAGDNLTARQPKISSSATTNDSGTKSERQITMGEVEWYNEFDPMEFNQDWDFLWTQGASVDSVAAQQLINAIMPSAAANYNFTLEKVIWNGDLGSGDTSLARFDGFIKQFVADSGVIDVTGATPTAANIISELEKIVAACPAAVQEKGNPTIIMSHTDKYLYREAARGLDVKGTNVDGRIGDQFGGYPIVSTHGLNAGDMVMTNVGSGDDSNLKLATWADADRMNVKTAPTGPLDDTWGVRILAEMGVNHVIGAEVVYRTDV